MPVCAQQSYITKQRECAKKASGVEASVVSPRSFIMFAKEQGVMKRTLVIGSLIIALLSVVAAAQTSAVNAGAYVKSQQARKPQQASAPPAANLNPYSLDFKDQVVKQGSKPQRITLTNTGGKPLYINSIVIVDDNRDDFTMSGDTCTGSTIAPGKSCVIDVSFTPSATGNRKSTLTVTDNAVDSPQRAPLTGSGINSAAVPPSGKP
jgi:HYDIN/CFA65/VesB family protein